MSSHQSSKTWLLMSCKIPLLESWLSITWCPKLSASCRSSNALELGYALSMCKSLQNSTNYIFALKNRSCFRSRYSGGIYGVFKKKFSINVNLFFLGEVSITLLSKVSGHLIVSHQITR